jgi:hypothetical protein
MDCLPAREVRIWGGRGRAGVGKGQPHKAVVAGRGSADPTDPGHCC